MRSEKEMLALILSFAEKDENIRVVVMNGSRANPSIEKDLFQDYDIRYFARNTKPLIRNFEIVDYFGDLMILQLPDDMGETKPSNSGKYTYLMQFMDGNRIDLGIYPLSRLQETLASDSLTVVLLDKDGQTRGVRPASDLDYRPEVPTEKIFLDCCNEFWWLNPYVAKGLWRKEIIYSKYFLDDLLRGELMKLLEWYFGIKTGFEKSMGKQGKFLEEVLTAQEWQLLKATYSDSKLDHIWQALYSMGNLFRIVAVEVANYFEFRYLAEEDRKVTDFLYRIQALPEDAKNIEELD